MREGGDAGGGGGGFGTHSSSQLLCQLLPFLLCGRDPFLWHPSLQLGQRVARLLLKLHTCTESSSDVASG